MSTPCLTEATRLAVNAKSVMPIRADKKPYLASWKQLQSTPATVEQVMEWWERYPDANVGLITGKISGLTVVDVDSYKPGASTIDMFPETYTVRTGNNGYQLYYQYAPGLTISANGYPQHPHVDIRNDGGYVCAPPSVTSYLKDGVQSGGKYTVIKDIPLAPFPIHLFPNSKPKKTLKDTIGVLEGGRNDNLASFIGTLLTSHKESEWDSLVLPAVRTANLTYTPPLSNDEVLTTYKSIVALEHNRRAAIGDAEEVTDDEDAIRTAFRKSKISACHLLAQYIVKKYDIITIGEKEREMFVYQHGQYQEGANSVIYPEIQRVLGNMSTKSAKGETFSTICDMTMSTRDTFTTAKLNLIPLLNGVYCRDTQQLLPHSPDYRFTFQFPITYDAVAACPKTSAFFDQIFTLEQRVQVEEWIGYYFYRNYMFKKAIIFVGDGDTGKTTLLETIDFLLGKQNISSVSLQKMTTDKFAAAHMFEKHGNLVDELSAKDISDTGNFKIATGGGSISGEYKFGNQFSFRNFSKLTFACNRIPDVKDFDDTAYFNRWMVVHFEKTIENRIPNFIKTLTTDAERSGLFNLAMQALTRLLTNGGFSYAMDATDTKREMLRGGSSIAMFAAEAITQALGAEVTKEDMYDAYTNFCMERDVPADTIKMLGTRLPFYVNYMSEGISQAYGKKVRAWRNVQIIQKASIEDAANAEFNSL
jgi:P4 family phage/plasmid primase-like protien